MTKEIDLEGFGRIVINPINFHDKEYDSVDIEGKPLKWVSGSMSRGYFENCEGLKVPESQVCKKIEIEGEVILQPKMTPTKEVKNDDIEVVDSDDSIYTAIERKPYKIFTESEKIKDLILKQNKSLRFPLVVGNGYKMYCGVLTNWQGQIVLCGCRGNINEALSVYADDVVDIEIDVIPQNLNAKKLLKALVMVR